MIVRYANVDNLACKRKKQQRLSVQTNLGSLADAEIRLTVQSVSYENRGTNTVHIPTKQG